jgi:hypothetical protein
MDLPGVPRSDVVDWLLEPANPSARYLALTDLLGYPPEAPEVMSTRAAIPAVPPALSILEAQYPATPDRPAPSGFWIKPDVGYSPKYRATVWQILFLAQLGAPAVPAIRAACEHVLEHSRRPGDGCFVAGQEPHTAIDCLNGNLLWAMQRLGYGGDARLVEVREATARTIVRRGYACRYNSGLECAWGGIKVMRALLDLPLGQRSAEVDSSIARGTDLLLSVPLLQAAYPARSSVSDRWFQLAFPLTYTADLLEAMTVLALAGHAAHPHVQAGLLWLLHKRDASGRWRLGDAPRKTWASWGMRNRANKWVTLRALRLLHLVA